MKSYDHTSIERKWQEKWRENKQYRVTEEETKEKCYVLDMFPYPSGEGLHVGHPKGYIASDVYARHKSMQGYNVLHPMGWDAFGLPAENFAIKHKVHPRKAVEKNVARFKEQLEKIGFTYDWEREINTTDPEYYTWTQWIFLQLHKKGLAYESYEPINWCPGCKTGLANEDLVDGNRCERCDSVIEKKPMRQWVLRITDYADRMLQDLDELPWSDSVKTAQQNWIGKSEGSLLRFEVKSQNSKGKSAGQNLKVVIVHGCPSDKEKAMDAETRTYDKHWAPWLEQELTSLGFEVHRPLMPSPWAPDYDTWSKVMDSIGVDENTILIGHRCGGAFLCRYLQSTQQKVRKLILVSPAYAPKGVPANEQVKDFYDFPLLTSLSEHVGETVLFTSDNDPYRDHVLAYGEVLAGTVVDLPNHGHFVERDMGTVVFPELLQSVTAAKQSSGDLHDSTTYPLQPTPYIEVFTTRADTLYGATYLVLAPEHGLVAELLENKESGIENYEEVQAYIEQTKKKKELERKESKEKTGVELKGIKAINPGTQEEIPIWIADYVLSGYGTGAIMAVPAHDERDNEFAKKFNLPIRNVVAIETGQKRENEEKRDGGCAVVFDPISQRYAVYRNQDGTLGLFGGGVDESEDMIEGILREVEEESGLYNYGYRESIGDARAHYRHATKKFNRIADAHAVLVILEGTETKDQKLEEHETFELHWATADEVLQNWRDTDPEGNREHYGWFLKRGVARAIELGLDTSSDPLVYVYVPHTGQGVLVNSGPFTGLSTEDAKTKITEHVGGKVTTQYRLQDWVFSRQRYWGEPIPIIHCEACGAVPVPEEQLPVLLPEVDSYEPTGTGESPLANISSWVNTTCPTCKGPGKRETNTMPQWAGSSWYYLRYMDPRNQTALVGKDKEKYWAPVDVYVGGMEHATRHLIYARFWHKFLYDIGIVSTKEPFQKLYTVGLIEAEDGRKMSKRWGNVINPDDVVAQLGADVLRIYEMFMGPFGQAIAWNTNNTAGARRFLEKVYGIKESTTADSVLDDTVTVLLQQTIKKVGADIETFSFNTAISQLMVLTNALEKLDAVPVSTYETLIRLLAPFAPHLTEELWESLGHETSVHLEPWPTYDEVILASAQVTIAVQVQGKTRGTFTVAPDTGKEAVLLEAKGLESVMRQLEGKEIVKEIYVPGRLVNFVVR